MAKVCHLDYETRSRANLKTVGAHRYAIGPSFEILMASVSRDEEDETYLWVNPKFRTPDMLGDNEEAERILAEADQIVGHNVYFEQACTWGAETQGKTRPLAHDDLSRWRCTAAMARRAGLPWSLDKLGEALRLPVQKDRRGKALINFFCVPREDGQFNEPRDFPAEWREFGDYCITDNRVEKGAHHKLKPFELTGALLDTFQFDLRMNQRGIPINVVAARNAQKIVDEMQAGAAVEFRDLVGLNPTQGEKFKDWLSAQAFPVPNLQAETVSDILAGPEVPVKIKQVLTLYQSLSYAAVKKIQTMLDCVCPDGFIRGTFLFYGAGTGRWSAQKLQPHNFRKTDPEFREMMDAIYRAICAGIDAKGLDVIYGSPLECLANIIRAFIHLPGVDILDGDYSAVEARIICWLAGQTDVLAKWAAGEDLYKWMASHIYGVPIEKVDTDQREVGKRVILGAGFQMGWRKFQSSCKIQYQLDLPKDLCKKGVKLFRSLCGKIRDYWWQLNNSAIQCIETGQPCGAFSIRRVAGVKYLLFKLRSGRSLAYPHVEVNVVKWVPEVDEDNLDEYGEVVIPEAKYRKEITYWGQLPMSQQWGRIKLYGGKLAENETQATAADIMAHGAIVAERRGMAPFMLVHDQGLALRTARQTADGYSAALAALPDWATGLPIKVESKVLQWWKK